MKTAIQFYLDDKYYEDGESSRFETHDGNHTWEEVEYFMIKYAKLACKEQRELCAEEALISIKEGLTGFDIYMEDCQIDKISILNALSPDLK